jgi:uncharacterized membrane protein
VDRPDRDAIWSYLAFPDDHQPSLWDHPLAGGAKTKETKLFTDNPRRGFNHPAFLPGGAGHGAASPGPFGVVHLLGDALHLVTAAFWPGALAPLAAFLLLLLKSSQVEAIGLAASVVRRFSASSLIAVAALALTGLLNGIFMVGSFQALVTSAYGRILVCKVVLFFVMIGFGAINLFLLKPRIEVNLPTVHFAQKNATRLLLRKRPFGNRIGCGCNPYCWIAWNHSAAYALTACCCDICFPLVI